MLNKQYQYILKLKLSLIFLVVFGINSYAQIDQYAIKTSFLFKFAKYTEWPKSNSTIFTVAVIGKNPFKDSLNEIALKKYIKGKQIKIEYIDYIHEIKNPNILFIPKSERKLVSKIVEATKKKPILLISEIDNVATKGVHINFYLNKEKKIRFEININSLKQSKLKMSALLINVAKII